MENEGDNVTLQVTIPFGFQRTITNFIHCIIRYIDGFFIGQHEEGRKGKLRIRLPFHSLNNKIYFTKVFHEMQSVFL